MKIIIGLLIFSVLTFSFFFYFKEYRSAFEADQACHADKWTMYKDQENYGCDHDIETHQWILFKIGEDHSAASVLHRYQY